jgi:plasmid stabilization system protein ParE
MTYSVSISDAAEAEMEKAYLHLNRVSPEIAGRWYAGLLRAIATLEEMPRRHPLAREGGRYQIEIRQMLYGRGKSIYRVLFAIVEPEAGEYEANVRILHIRHAAQHGPTSDID